MKMLKNVMVMMVVFAFAKANSQQAASFQFDKEITDCQAKTNLLYQLPTKSTSSNQSNFDLKGVKLELSVDPEVALLQGKAHLTFTAMDDLTSIALDFANSMNAIALTSSTGPASMQQDSDDVLSINFENTVIQGTTVTIAITYDGDPVGTGFGSYARQEHNGAGIIWTLSEPYGAKSWWPTKQDLTDKIDVTEVIVTVPENLTAVSNGLLKNQLTINGYSTFSWKHEYPIPAYLIAFAVTNYEKYSQTFSGVRNTFSIVNYVYPENLQAAKQSVEATIPIMQLFENQFGPYPYDLEKYGHAQFNWGGGMEHTTLSFMNNFSQNLIAHELAHQWFGDKVTCGSWQDIWLNESFATYATGKSIEAINGDQAFKTWREQTISNVISKDDGSVYVPATDTLNVSRVFNGRLSYRKGSMVLHMLQRKMGQTAFTKTLKDYLTDPNLEFNYAKTNDFIRVANANSEVDLQEFFNDWIFGEGHPSYIVESRMLSNGMVSLLVNQTTSHSSVDFFEGNLPLRLVGENGETLDVNLDLAENGQEFLREVRFRVSEIIIDPDKHIISKDNTATLTTATNNLPEIRIYPNPTIKGFYLEGISSKLLSVTIHDLQGRLISVYSTESGVSDRNYYEISQPSGLYFVSINTINGTAKRQLVIR